MKTPWDWEDRDMRRKHVPKPTHTLPRLRITNNTKPQTPRIQHPHNLIPATHRLLPPNRRRYVNRIRVGIRIATARVRDEIGLICLGEGAEAGDYGL